MRSAFLMMIFALGITAAAATASTIDSQTPAAKATTRSSPRGSSAKATPSAPVNLNTATEAQLETLPGVGPKVAQRIIEFRQKNGNFKKAEDLMNVRGIGEKNFLKLKPLVTVGAEKANGTDR
jgi:competence protein ComEA